MTTHKPRKRFGQHFLRDQEVIDHILTVISPTKDDYLVEIGPGLGALTIAILPTVNRLAAIELDRNLINELKKQCSSLENFSIYQADALAFNFQQLTHTSSSLRVIGNLPYNISTPLLFHLFDQIHFIKDMHFMLQKEVADRLAARPGNKIYGRLSVMSQYYCAIEILFTVPSIAFYPQPKVDSAFIRLAPYKQPPYQAKNTLILANTVRQAFSKRRKTLKNALKGLISEEDLRNIGVDPIKRPEELSVEQFVQISNFQ